MSARPCWTAVSAACKKVSASKTSMLSTSMFFGAYGRARGGVKGSSAPGTRPRHARSPAPGGVRDGGCGRRRLLRQRASTLRRRAATMPDWPPRAKSASSLGITTRGCCESTLRAQWFKHKRALRRPTHRAHLQPTETAPDETTLTPFLHLKRFRPAAAATHAMTPRGPASARRHQAGRAPCEFSPATTPVPASLPSQRDCP
jgi:hypothetical protein